MSVKHHTVLFSPLEKKFNAWPNGVNFFFFFFCREYIYERCVTAKNIVFRVTESSEIWVQVGLEKGQDINKVLFVGHLCACRRWQEALCALSDSERSCSG